jgi:hypothetical protein
LTGKIDHRGALFGKFPVGETLEGNLYYTKRTLCGDQTPGTPDSIKQEGYFLLVDRGGCTFVEKVRNAQRDNATAVFIADNTCLCVFGDACEEEGQECEDSEPTMDDDGSGDDIRIPSMMLFKPDSDKLKTQLVEGNFLRLQLSWPVPPAINGRTVYTLWMTPDDLLSHHFLMSFLDAAIALSDKAVFKPKMFIKDGTEKGCRKYEESESDPCPGFCTNNGRYCEPRSYYDFEVYDNKGTRMVVESLRRACIWHVYGEGDGLGVEWWTYVRMWIQRCASSHSSSSCSMDLFETAGINGELVEECMVQSGDFREDNENLFLDNYLDEATDYDITFAPALFVNGAVIRGSLTFGTALEAICMTYDANDTPDICHAWTACAESCSSEATCAIVGEQCVEYEVPTFNHDEINYDDDYIENKQAITQAEEATYDTKTTAAPTKAPTSPPVLSPTNPPTDPPVVSPTDAPVVPPTDPPFAPIMDAPVAPVAPPITLPVLDPDKPQAPNQPPGYAETIQIFENGQSDSGSFAAGLGAGIAAAVAIGVVIFVILRDRQRQDMMRPLVPGYSVSPSELSMGGGNSYYSDHFDDERTYDEERTYDSRTRRARVIPRFPRKGMPRRSIRRSRRDPIENETVSLRHEYGDEETVQFEYEENAATQSRRFREKEEEKQSFRSRQYDDDDDSLQERR